MFPRVLAIADHSRLELDWWGCGPLQVRTASGGTITAAAEQAGFLRDALACLQALAPDNARARDELLRATLALFDEGVGSAAWRGALYEGPTEFAKLALEHARIAGAAPAAAKPAVTAPHLEAVLEP